MKTKKIVILIGILLALILIIKTYLPVKYPKKALYFTQDPSTWVEEKILTKEANDARVNVMRATQGHSTFSGNRQIYHLENSDEAFFTYGNYNGIPFVSKYIEKNTVLMEISQNLNPDDNIIQAFILAKKSDEGFVFYIFVDEDWKNKLKYTNIIYGRNFSMPSTLVSKSFSYNEIRPGIYMDSVNGYTDWYEENPVAGGILLGEITISDLSKAKTNSTYVMLR